MNRKKVFFPNLFTITLALLLDLVFIFLADLTSFIIRFNGRFPKINFEAYLNIAFFIFLLRMCAFYVFHLYVKPKYKSNFEILVNTIKACTASSVIIVFAVYFLDIEAYPRSLVIISWMLTIIFASSWRLVVKELVSLYLGKDFFRSHFLVIGTNKHAQSLATQMSEDKTVDHKFLGFVGIKKNGAGEIENGELLGTVDDLPSLVNRYTVDEIILAESITEKSKIATLINLLGRKRIAIKSVPSAYDSIIENMILHGYAMPFEGPIVTAKPAFWYSGIKRLLDIAVSVIMLILTFPLLFLSILLVKITSPGPVFYYQKRTGLNGSPFVLYKIRTMRLGSEEKDHPIWTKRHDLRITPVGRLLRRFRIDELPQLINVLRNEMSLIGPRPERPYFTNKLLKKIPFYAGRLQLKPGITGWAQVNFKYAATEKDAEEKLIYDLFYIQNMSFALDLLIALKTLKVIITGEGAR